MRPLTSPRRILAAGLLILLAAPTFANPLAESEAEKARKLVRQLASGDFRARESASNELVRMGSAVEPILREGFDYPDPEVRFRCRHLLPLALSYDLEKRLQAFLAQKETKELPPPAGWARFKEIVGDDKQTRDLFAQMHRYDAEIMANLENKPAELRDKLAARCTDLMSMQNYNVSRNTGVPADQLSFILFACLDPKVKLGPEPQSYLNSALHSMSYAPRTKEMVKTSPPIRKLLLKYLSDGGSYAASNSLYILSNLEMPEVVDFARKILKGPTSDIYGKGMALSVLGRFGGKESVPEILPFLDDKSSIGMTQFGNGNQINTQMRDVALATLVQLTGQNLRDYDFAYLKMFGGRVAINNFSMSPSLLGFSDDAARDAAQKRWKDWYAKNKETLTKK
jgi:hypothetical protein